MHAKIEFYNQATGEKMRGSQKKTFSEIPQIGDHLRLKRKNHYADFSVFYLDKVNLGSEAAHAHNMYLLKVFPVDHEAAMHE